MNVRWVVQNNFRSDADDPNWIRRACEKFGFIYEGFKVVPFTDSIPKFTHDVPTIFYGGTGWINKIYESDPTQVGIFFNPKSTFDFWNEKYGNKSLNADAIITTFNQLPQELLAQEFWFVRPTRDLKEFSGAIMRYNDILSWRDKIFTDSPDLGNIPIVIGRPYILSHEWRLFIINGKVCTGSQYRTYFVRNTSREVPGEVIDFAEEQAKIYSPSPVFVMDVCKSAGHLYVVEIGCFNSAGFYESDIEKLVREVSNYLLEAI